MSYAKQLRKELLASNKILIFEVEVFSKIQDENDWISFDIEVDLKTNQLRAYHVPFTKEEEESNKIAFEFVDIDECFSLDEHLQDLYTGCMEAIMSSEFYELID
jgi:hypothetical protein